MTVPSPRPTLTLKGCIVGAKLVLPLVPGVVAFGIAYGALALQKGLTLAQTLLMSAIVYSGAGQMVALELWQDRWTWAGILGIFLVTAAIGARMILMGASLQPWLSGLPRGQVAANLYLMTDANWLVAIRYRSEGGRDVGIFFGAGIMLWVVWAVAALPGYLAGSLLEEPRRFGLDLFLPIYFATMLVPLWKGARLALPWLVAGGVALAVHAAFPSHLYIVAGALAGAVTGGLMRARP